MSQSSDRIAHRWVYAKEGESYDFNSYNTSYTYDRFYSYRSVLAKRVDENTIIIDKNVAHYSNTSRDHYGSLLSAIPNNINVLTFPFNENPIDYYFNELTYLYTKQKRARVANYFRQINELRAEATNYIKVSKLDNRKKEVRKLRELIDNNELDGIEEKLAVAQNIANTKRVEKARELAQVRLNSFLGRDDIKWEQGKVYMKIDGDKLKLSNQITVSLRESIALYKRWIAGKPILGIKFDQYTILRASEESFTAGCTTLTRIECDRIYGTIKDN